MIRYPERFHASVTPDAHQIGVEPNYLEDRREPHRVNRHVEVNAKRDRPSFDFTALAAALEH